MAATRSANGFDVIVIGSGMGGTTRSAALSRSDHWASQGFSAP